MGESSWRWVKNIQSWRNHMRKSEGCGWAKRMQSRFDYNSLRQIFDNRSDMCATIKWNSYNPLEGLLFDCGSLKYIVQVSLHRYWWWWLINRVKSNLMIHWSTSSYLRHRTVVVLGYTVPRQILRVVSFMRLHDDSSVDPVSRGSYERKEKEREWLRSRSIPQLAGHSRQRMLPTFFYIVKTCPPTFRETSINSLILPLPSELSFFGALVSIIFLSEENGKLLSNEQEGMAQ